MTASIPQTTLYDANIPWNSVYRKRMVMVIITTHAAWFADGDLQWISENYEIWEAFEREANKVWDTGRRHYSARTIGEYLRHETALRETENEHHFKVNDHAWPSLARLYMLIYPERYGFFEKRTGQSAVRAI